MSGILKYASGIIGRILAKMQEQSEGHFKPYRQRAAPTILYGSENWTL
jgi:hypothetical protein